VDKVYKKCFIISLFSSVSESSSIMLEQSRNGNSISLVGWFSEISTTHSLRFQAKLGRGNLYTPGW